MYKVQLYISSML